jgi:D-alanine transaminase
VALAAGVILAVRSTVRSGGASDQASFSPGGRERTMPSRTLACLNGDTMPADEARVPIWDRGFLFGDAVYEVYRLYQGRCWLEDEHTARLRRSLCELDFPAIDLGRLRRRIADTIAASEVDEGTVYVQITRGVAPRAHAFPAPGTQPTELIVVKPYDDTPTARLRETGASLLSYPDLRWKRCDIKTVNLLGNVMACEAAKRSGALEAVLIDADGRVTESTHSSLLWVRDGTLEGTPEGHEILPGTTRAFAVGLARAIGVPFREATVTLNELEQADEVLLSGTTIEIMPVTRVDDREVGGGAPGPITRRLQRAFRETLQLWLGP